MDIKLNFEGYEGTVTMKVANNIERLELMDDMGIDIFQLAKGKGAKEGLANQKTIIKLLKASKDFYKKVELKKDGKSYSSFDDLVDDIACQGVLMECAIKALIGMGDAEKK